jgi:MFS family permease
MVGSFVDAVGLRKAFLLGFALCLVSRGVMTFSTVRWLALPFGLLPLALGESLMTPVMVAAVKRYSTTRQRSISFAIYYAMMNLGIALAGIFFDRVRGGLGELGHYCIPLLGIQLTTYRTLFLLSFLFSIPGLLIMYFGIREGVEATDEGVRFAPEKPSPYPGEGAVRALWLSSRDALKETARIFSGLWAQPAFYKFLAFLALVVGVRLITFNMYYIYPKFGIRVLGPGAQIGRLWAVNQFLIVFLAPLAGALTQRFPAYKTVAAGSLVSALSVLFMAAPQALFEPLADGRLGDWIGHAWLGVQGPVHPYYVSILFFVVAFSIGEAVWSPRLYEYPAAIAPKGQEASYMALSMLPFFVAKFFIGMLSGHLLQTYCPAEGARDPQTLWLWIGVFALLTPIGLFLLRPFIQVEESGR